MSSYDYEGTNFFLLFSPTSWKYNWSTINYTYWKCIIWSIYVKLSGISLFYNFLFWNNYRFTGNDKRMNREVSCMLCQGLPNGNILHTERRGWQRVRWLDSLNDSMDMSLSKLWEIVKYTEAWSSTVCGVTKSWTRLSDWQQQQLA